MEIFSSGEDLVIKVKKIKIYRLLLILHISFKLK
jgi:hypothetical protein